MGQDQDDGPGHTNRTVKEGFMKGWKTWVGGITLIVSGIGAILTSVDWETFTVDGDLVNEGIALIGAGFAAIGVGHKIEKGKQ